MPATTFERLTFRFFIALSLFDPLEGCAFLSFDVVAERAVTMKRTHSTKPTEARKKQHQPLKDVESVCDQAEKYRLATVKFPIDALTPEWSIGMNRPINEGHKRRLLQIFKETGVLRQDVNHRLHVACTKAQIERMFSHISQKGSQVEGAAGASENTRDVELLSFDDWNSVVGEKAELIAGNHRVEAFKEYLRYSGSVAAERWWGCNLYDRGTLMLLLLSASLLHYIPKTS